jgi:microcystin-dependent protein
MPRNGSGTYTLPQPAFIPSTTISSTAVNSDLSDIALALTGSVAADGQTPITGALKLPDGSVGAPSYSFITDTSDGFYHPSAGKISVSIGGVETFSFGAPTDTLGSGLLGLGGAVLVPIGLVVDLAGPTVPAGWFLCYGQTISRTDYSELWDAIGDAWGDGDGSTTFNLPDLRGRVTFGKDDMGGSSAGRNQADYNGDDLGNDGGDQDRSITIGRMPSHDHGFSGTTSGVSANHNHSYNIASSSGAQKPSGSGSAPFDQNAGSTTSTESGDHTHTYSGNTSSTGSGSTFSIINPSAVTNKIIFAGHP